MKNISIFLVLIIVIFFGSLPISAKTSTKFETIHTEYINKYICEVKNPMNSYNNSKPVTAVEDMIYPETILTLVISISYPEKLASKVDREIKATFAKKHLNQIKTSLIKGFKKLDLALAQAEKVFQKTQNENSSKKNKSRTTAIANLNKFYVKFLDSIEDNIKISKTISSVKKQLSKKFSQIKMDYCFQIQCELLPQKKKSILTKWINGSTNRKSFINKLPKFAKLDSINKNQKILLPIITYMDFPCEYISTSYRPEIEGLIALPNGISENNLYHAHHVFTERNWPGYRRNTLGKKKNIFSYIHELSNEYAESLFSNKLDPKKYKSLNATLQKKIIAEKKDLMTGLEDNIFKQIFQGIKISKDAKKNYGFVEELGLKKPAQTTNFLFKLPNQIDFNEDFTLDELEKEFTTHHSNYIKLVNNLITYNQKLLKVINELNTNVANAKPVINKEFKKFFTNSKIAKPISFLMMRNKIQANNFINNWQLVRDFVNNSKRLWTKLDILKFQKNKPELAKKLKMFLLKEHEIFNCWQDARINSFDKHEYLQKVAFQIANNNNPKTKEAYEFIKSYSTALVSEIEQAITTMEVLNTDKSHKLFSNIDFK